MINVIIYT